MSRWSSEPHLVENYRLVCNANRYYACETGGKSHWTGGWAINSTQKTLCTWLLAIISTPLVSLDSLSQSSPYWPSFVQWNHTGAFVLPEECATLSTSRGTASNCIMSHSNSCTLDSFMSCLHPVDRLRLQITAMTGVTNVCITTWQSHSAPNLNSLQKRYSA